jgi:hypothetical protein
MANLHLEILDDRRQLTFQKLSLFRSLGFLAGGTALALQIGYRISYDFDIFCSQEIDINFPVRVKEIMSIKKILVNNSDEFTFITEDDIKISFIHYPFKMDGLLVEDNGLPITLLSPLGVAVSKAYALNRRNAWRDYLDIYSVVKNELATLDEIIRTAKEVYKELFSEKLFLAQLVYTDDISDSEIGETPVLQDKVSLKEVKAYFQKAVDDYWQNTQQRI